MRSKGLILIIDDDREMTRVIGEYLISQGFETRLYGSASEAWFDLTDESSALKQEVQLVLTDLRIPGMNGLQFVSQMHQSFPQIPVILMTAFGGIETAVEATKKGAFHYLTKPFRLHDLSILIERALTLRGLHQENELLKNRGSHFFHGMLAKSEVMKRLFDKISLVAPTEAHVLITGESGTGKELVAKALHQLSSRKDQPFVGVNVAAIPEGLLESEFFGYEKGAFTGADKARKGFFEQAHGGTLFLDEIGDLSLPLQAKLLRVLQEKKVRSVGGLERPIDVRVFSATHRNLKNMIGEGSFREDLYYRLAVVELEVPPLRQRKEDIEWLARHFVEQFAVRNHKSIKGLSKDALTQLRALPLKGNVRELENLIERAVIFCAGDLLEAQDLPASRALEAEALLQDAKEHLPTLEEFERQYIEFVLNRVGGQKERAAKILGVHRRTLLRKEKEWGQNALSSEGLDETNCSESELDH